MSPDRAGGQAGLVLRAGAATDVGVVREQNEDSVLADRVVFLVADGMGGHAAGEVASSIATATLGELVDRPSRTPEDVVAALALANRRILESAARHPGTAGMGTTAAGLVVVEVEGSQQCAVFNVGDSRVYRFADSLRLVSVDHSEVRELVDAGIISEDEALHHPLRNIVTRALGSDPAPTPDVWLLAPQPGERFVNCSDGLTNEVPDEQIAEVLHRVEEPQACADALVAAALEAGGRDNVSVVVVAVEAG